MFQLAVLCWARKAETPFNLSSRSTTCGFDCFSQLQIRIFQVAEARFQTIPLGWKTIQYLCLNFMLHGLFQRMEANNERMIKVLGITPIDQKKSMIDMAYSMIESGKVKKTRDYKGPPSDS